MKSVINVQIGKPSRTTAGVRLPFALDVSDDDSDDDDMPEVDYAAMQIVLSDKILATGIDAVRESAKIEFQGLRNNFTTAGYEKIMEAIDFFLSKNDVTKMALPYIPEPENRSVH